MANLPKFCSSCGAPLREGAKFCAKCGAKIVVPVEPIKEEPVATEPQIKEEPIPQEVKEELVVEEPQEQVEEPVKEEPPVEEEPAPVEEPVIEPKEDVVKPAETVKQDDSSTLAKAILLGGAGYIFGHAPIVQEEEEDAGAYDDLLEPRKKYLESLEKAQEDNATAYFDELVKESGVDVNANSEAMRDINKLEAKKALLEKKLNKTAKHNGMMFLAILLMSSGFAVFMIMGIFAFTEVLEDFPFLMKNSKAIFIGAGLGIALSIILFIVKAILKKRGQKTFGPQIQEIEQKLEALKNLGYEQMAPLNNLFDFNIFNKIMRKTTPLIKVDDHPDMAKVESLINKFNWKHNDGRYNSTLYMKTGSIMGNPFLLYRAKEERMVNETYTGSLTITWTKKVTIGKTTTYVPVTQVLTASVTKPRPDYSEYTYLVYGCEAAPHLSFSRSKMISDYTPKGLKKFFKEREKFIDNYAKKHPEFTPLGNDEFEDYFDGINRDNEVEYRLLFTPLAQRSMLDIITNQLPFGDNFYFNKNKMLNTIGVNGMGNVELEGDPRAFMGYDIEKIRENFIKLNKDYFKNFYFHLAPLLAIPLYQQYPTEEYIFKHNQEQRFSTDLCEMLANRFSFEHFAPPQCATPTMLKCESVSVSENSVLSHIHSYGYKRVEHVDYFSKLGGDGYYHEVPVRWYEYIPVEKVVPFVAHETYLNKKEFEVINKIDEYKEFYNKVNNNSFSFFKGYFSFIGRPNDTYSPKLLNDLIKEKLK